MSASVPPLSSTSSSSSLPASAGLSPPHNATTDELSSSTRSSTSSSMNPPRLSRLSSNSGSLSQKSLQSFRTVSLPGLFPGTHLGILASGLLDKRRDGAVRGGWAKRLFILSTKSLHYYRKVEEFELFGKERGQVLLSDMGYAKLVVPEDAPYGAVEPNTPSYFCAVLSKRKSLLMFLRADSLEYAQCWVNIINYALQTAKSVDFSPKWSIETMQTFIAAASGNFQDLKPEEEKSEEVASTSTQAPKVLVISVASTTDFSPQTTTERVVKRQVELSSEIKLGAFRKKDFCILVLSDGEELHIPHHILGTNPASLLTAEKEIVLSTPPRSQDARPNIVSVSKVYVRFRCTRLPPAPVSPQPSGVQPLIVNQPSAFSIVFPGALGGLFLLSSMISFYWASPFEGLMKITIVLGILLSISQIAQFVIAYAPQSDNLLLLKSGTMPAATKSSTSSSASSLRDNDLIFFLRVDKIEVIESDQGLESNGFSPLSTTSGVESAEDGTGDGADADASSAASISGGPLPFSARFIAAEKGDEEKGRQRYQNTLQWRRENEIDNILVTPHPTFETIKKYYPQYFHGRSRAGQPVYYERPGKIDLAALKREGLSIEDLLRHYMYITEYLWRVIEPSDTGRSLTVLDVTGIGMYDLGGEVLDFIKRASAFTGAHYPERSAHIFIINIPGWFNMIWRMVKPMIDPVTREKVHMLKGSAILRELETLIDIENIPRDLGGKGPALGESQEEIELLAHVNNLQRGVARRARARQMLEGNEKHDGATTSEVVPQPNSAEDLERYERLKAAAPIPGSEFHAALSSGNVDDVKFLLQHGSSVGADQFGETPLLYAAWSSNGRVVEVLIENGAIVDFKNRYGRTALSFAAERGNIETIKVLLKHGANLNIANSDGRTPLAYAADWGTFEAAREPITHGAVLEASDIKGRTALSYAATSRGGHDKIHALIEAGADQHTTDIDGRTPLSYAAECGKADVVSKLLDNGAVIDAKDNIGRTAFSFGAQGRHLEVVHVLLQRGAFDPSSYTKEKVDLFVAATLDDHYTLNTLIKKGVSINEATNDGRTPIFYAAEWGRTELVQVLMDNGAAVRSRSSHPDRNGETPLILAGRGGHMKILQALIDAEAPVNIRSGDGETPLISAARWDYFTGVQSLVVHGG